MIRKSVKELSKLFGSVEQAVEKKSRYYSRDQKEQ